MSEDNVEYGTGLAAAMSGTNGHAPTVLTRLCALDRVFVATGMVDVKVGEKVLSLPIRGVDNEAVESLTAHLRPKPPVRSELNQGKRTIIVNEADPDYLQKLAEYNRLTSYVYVFMALDLDILDEHEKVVWSADNTIHDIEGARKALRQAGIVDNQMATILTAAANLTRVVEETQLGD